MMNNSYVGKIYNTEEIERVLKDRLPDWTYSDEFLKRVFKTSGWRVSLMVTNAVGHLSEVAWHHPKIIISYNEVEILLNTHDAEGITDRDFALAEKIEEFVDWSPDESGHDRLPGLPENSDFTYIRR